MSLICPLCGNNKLEDSLFCVDCSKKISSDFEINIHETSTKGHDSEELKSGNYDLKEDFPEVQKPEKEDYDSEGSDSKDYDHKGVNSVGNYTTKNSKKSGGSLFWIFIVVISLVGLFLVYNKTIRAKNLEQRAWNTAVNENSVSGYLDYIESHPNGIHFDDAQAGLMRLKENEAITWERLKVSENLDELTNFLRQYEKSPYIPLVRMRVDSLSWISALKMNSVVSYSEYIMNSQSGLINGDYISEASKRHEMLLQTYPVNNAEMDSLRAAINGFYTSLSEINYSGLYNYLAPEVFRFFDSGRSTRDRITGELVVTASQTGSHRFNFEPNLEGVRYEKGANGSYKVNVPLVKSYSENGSIVHLPGYIVHIETNSNFEIISIYETKPFPGSP